MPSTIAPTKSVAVVPLEGNVEVAIHYDVLRAGAVLVITGTREDVEAVCRTFIIKQPQQAPPAPVPL